MQLPLKKRPLKIRLKGRLNTVLFPPQFTCPEGMSTVKFWFIVHKNILDTGYGTLNYFKYLFFGSAGVGITEGSKAMIYGSILLLGISSYIIGILYFYFDIPRILNIIANQFNPFVEEMTKKLK